MNPTPHTLCGHSMQMINNIISIRLPSPLLQTQRTLKSRVVCEDVSTVCCSLNCEISQDNIHSSCDWPIGQYCLERNKLTAVSAPIQGSGGEGGRGSYKSAGRQSLGKVLEGRKGGEGVGGIH